ncbi:MAG: hypothetical protein ACK5WA_05775 [Alphaproteobacteria bacterium]
MLHTLTRRIALMLPFAAAPALAQAPGVSLPRSGGILGVRVRSALPHPADLTRGWDRPIAELHQRPPATVAPWDPGLRAWVDRADARYPIGSSGTLTVSAVREGFIQIVSVWANGNIVWLTPEAVAGARSVRIGAGGVLEFPRADDLAFAAYPVRAPVGAAVLLVIHSSVPLPGEEAARVVQGVEARRAAGRLAQGREDAAAAVRSMVQDLGQRVRDWRARSIALPYEVVAATGAAPSPGAPASSPALGWLQADGRDIRVDMAETELTTRRPVSLGVTIERPSDLLILALGSGGLVDVLFPHSEARNGRVSSGQRLDLPGRGAAIEFRLRPVAGALPQRERILAIAQPPDLAPLLNAGWVEGDVTRELLPGTAAFTALEERLRARRGMLAIGERAYLNRSTSA